MKSSRAKTRGVILVFFIWILLLSCDNAMVHWVLPEYGTGDNGGTNEEDNENYIRKDGNTWTVIGIVNIDDDMEIPPGVTLVVPDGSTLIIDDGVTVTNNGEIVIDDGGTLINNGITDNSGEIVVDDGGTLINHGEITIDEDGTLINRGVTNNNGEITVDDGGTLINHGVTNNTGEITVDDGGTLVNYGTVANSGDIVVDDGGTVVNSRNINNTGVITVSDYGTWIGNGYIHATSGNQTPVAPDYNIDNLNQTVGDVTPVTVTRKTGKSTGAVTVYYEGTDGTIYTKSTTPPTAAGTYIVTFDVAAAEGWNPATDLTAGILTINQHKQPVATDYNIGNMNQTEGSVTAVTIDPKSGKSDGAVNVYYESTDGTTYPKSTTPPTAAGTYNVTFDVAADPSNGWDAATGLAAGTLTINPDNGKSTPITEDYDKGNLTQTVGSTSAVNITPQTGKSDGIVTVWYEGIDGTSYVKSMTPPAVAGKYNVTFDVTETATWNPATGLAGGTLTINQTPVSTDYNSGNLNQTAGSVTPVTITPKSGKSDGDVTVYYEGTGGTTYPKSTTPPTAAGTYTVTFDVAPDPDNNWNAATGLTAGTLTINPAGNQTPVAPDYDIGNLNQTAWMVTPVTITPKAGKSDGTVTVYYEGADGTYYPKNTAVPESAGTYNVTFDVAAADGWNSATGLIAGTLTVTSGGITTWTVNGTVYLYEDIPAGITLVVPEDGTLIVPYGTEITNYGAVVVDDDGTFINSGTITNEGHIDVDDDGTLINNGAIINKGQIDVDSDSLLNIGTITNLLTIDINIAEIIDLAPTLSVGTLSRSGGTWPTLNITGTFVSIEWWLGSTQLGTGASLSLESVKSNFTRIQTYNLTLWVVVYDAVLGNQPFTRVITFEVVP
jgi:hypothetical protein